MYSKSDSTELKKNTNTQPVEEFIQQVTNKLIEEFNCDEQRVVLSNIDNNVRQNYESSIKNLEVELQNSRERYDAFKGEIPTMNKEPYHH